MKAVIAGGGIGGLAAAVALAQTGWTVAVLERATLLHELGAGVQISPNGMRALDWLGVTDRLRERMFEPDAISLRMGQSGRQVFRLPMKDYASKKWGAPFMQVHRADLQKALMSRLRELSGDVMQTGTQVTGYVREDGGASVYLSDKERIFGDLVIGADGVRSVIRAQMCGNDRARFTGNVAWRITVPVSDLRNPPPPEGVVWAGAKRHAVTTRIRAGDMVNFVGVVEQDDWREEGWSITGETSQALADFDGWHPMLRDVIASDPMPARWALFDRPPLARWTDGPVALLGDAAHPMLPSMAQGAVQALEDAVVLARLLERDTSIAAALKQYFDLRKPRATRIQKRSHDNLRMFHKSGLAKFATYAPLWGVGQIAPGLLQAQQNTIYGYDPVI